METTPIAATSGSNNTMLYAGIGVTVLILGVVAVVVLKKPALPVSTYQAATPTKPAATQGAASPSNETLLLSAIPALSNLGASIAGLFGSSDDSTT